MANTRIGSRVRADGNGNDSAYAGNTDPNTQQGAGEEQMPPPPPMSAEMFMHAMLGSQRSTEDA